jgi:hypothetical protein
MPVQQRLQRRRIRCTLPNRHAHRKLSRPLETYSTKHHCTPTNYPHVNIPQLVYLTSWAAESGHHYRLPFYRIDVGLRCLSLALLVAAPIWRREVMIIPNTFLGDRLIPLATWLMSDAFQLRIGSRMVRGPSEITVVVTASRVTS